MTSITNDRSGARSAMVASATLLLILLGGISGCSKPANTVKGTVSYGGKPISKGVITLTPSGEKGKPEGAKIINGAFEIKTITPGPKVVSVNGLVGNAIDTSAAPMTKDDFYNNKPQAKDEVIAVPVEAEGNGQIIEVKEGAQVIDIKLSEPGERR